MTAMISVSPGNSPRMCYINSGPSSVITNTVTETVFDQIFTYPSQSQRSVQPNILVRLKAYGIYSTGLLNLTLTLRARWGGIAGAILCSSGVLALAPSAANAGWSFDLALLIQAIGISGALEGQGYGSFSAGLLSILPAHMPNASTFIIDTTSASDLVLTAQWGTAAAANQIQLRTCVVEVDGA